MQFPQKQEVQSYLMLSQSAVEFFFLGWWWAESIFDRNNLNKQALATLLVLNEMK